MPDNTSITYGQTPWPTEPRNERIDRYCVKEERREHVKENKKYFIFTRWWDFHYSDGTIETLKMTEKFKK